MENNNRKSDIDINTKFNNFINNDFNTNILNLKKDNKYKDFFISYEYEFKCILENTIFSEQRNIITLFNYFNEILNNILLTRKLNNQVFVNNLTYFNNFIKVYLTNDTILPNMNEVNKRKLSAKVEDEVIENINLEEFSLNECDLNFNNSIIKAKENLLTLLNIDNLKTEINSSFMIFANCEKKILELKSEIQQIFENNLFKNIDKIINANIKYRNPNIHFNLYNYKLLRNKVFELLYKFCDELIGVWTSIENYEKLKSNLIVKRILEAEEILKSIYSDKIFNNFNKYFSKIRELNINERISNIFNYSFIVGSIELNLMNKNNINAYDIYNIKKKEELMILIKFIKNTYIKLDDKLYYLKWNIHVNSGMFSNKTANAILTVDFFDNLSIVNIDSNEVLLGNNISKLSYKDGYGNLKLKIMFSDKGSAKNTSLKVTFMSHAQYIGFLDFLKFNGIN